MHYSQKSEEAFSIELEKHSVHAGLSHHKEDNLNFETASTVSDDRDWQQTNESSAEEQGEDALSWAAVEVDIEWEKNLWLSDERSIFYLPPPPPESLSPHSQFSAQSENEEFDPWALAVSEEIAQAFPNAAEFFPQVEPD